MSANSIVLLVFYYMLKGDIEIKQFLNLYLYFVLYYFCNNFILKIVQKKLSDKGMRDFDLKTQIIVDDTQFKFNIEYIFFKFFYPLFLNWVSLHIMTLCFPFIINKLQFEGIISNCNLFYKNEFYEFISNIKDNEEEIKPFVQLLGKILMHVII